MPSGTMEKRGQGGLSPSDLLDVLGKATISERIKLRTLVDSLLLSGSEPGIRWQDHVTDHSYEIGLKVVGGNDDWTTALVAARVRVGGRTVEQVMAEFPGISRDQVLACVVYENENEAEAAGTV